MQIWFSGTQKCFKIGSHNHKFRDLGSQGVPKGFPGGSQVPPDQSSSDFYGRFWGHFWCQNRCLDSKQMSFGRGILWILTSLQDDRPCDWYWKKKQCFFKVFSFELVGFREGFFQVCVLKTSSKWASKWLQNDVENEIGNREGSKGRMLQRFPGFDEALRRLLGSQWEGKRGGG